MHVRAVYTTVLCNVHYALLYTPQSGAHASFRGCEHYGCVISQVGSCCFLTMEIQVHPRIVSMEFMVDRVALLSMQNSVFKEIF